METLSPPVLGLYGVGVVGVTLYLNHASLRVLFRPLFQLMETVRRLQEGDYRDSVASPMLMPYHKWEALKYH